MGQHVYELWVCVPGGSQDQADALGADGSEPHEAGKRHSDLAAQERRLPEQEGGREQRAQASGLRGRSEGPETRTRGQNQPDQARGGEMTGLGLINNNKDM